MSSRNRDIWHSRGRSCGSGRTSDRLSRQRGIARFPDALDLFEVQPTLSGDEHMAHVILGHCCKDASCVRVCPQNCIRPLPGTPEFETVEHLYIDPVGCIDCSACVEACPADAIKPLELLTAPERRYPEVSDVSFDAVPHRTAIGPARYRASLPVVVQDAAHRCRRCRNGRDVHDPGVVATIEYRADHRLRAMRRGRRAVAYRGVAGSRGCAEYAAPLRYSVRRRPSRGPLRCFGGGAGVDRRAAAKL